MRMARSHPSACVQIYTFPGGCLHLNGYEAFVNGTLPPKFPIRTAPRFQTAHPAYAWMNRVQAYSVGEVSLANAQVSYDVYAAL